jgi:hypothetical protein
MAHRTVRCATGLCPVRQPHHPTVRVRPLELLSSGPPDRSCRLSGAPSGACLTSARSVAHLMLLQATVGAVVAVTPLAHRTVRCYTGQSGATPDSPVNYSGAAPRIPEGEQFGVEFLGAPDTVRWCTGYSGAPDQDTLQLSFALFV